MSIVLALVEQVEDAAARRTTAARAERIRVQIGELAGVVPDALHFAFELAAAGTVLDGADLVIEPVPAHARCLDCAKDWAPGMPPDLVCPHCHSIRGELAAGRELRILDVAWAETRETPAAAPTAGACGAAEQEG